MTRDFYPFVENGSANHGDEKVASELEVRHPARIAVYDDASAAPRVVVIDPSEVRTYLEEITSTVSRLSREQVRELLSAVHRSARTPPARAE